MDCMKHATRTDDVRHRHQVLATQFPCVIDMNISLISNAGLFLMQYVQSSKHTHTHARTYNGEPCVENLQCSAVNYCEGSLLGLAS